MNRIRGRLTLAFLVVILVTLCSVSLALFFILRNSPLEERQAQIKLNVQAQGIAAILKRLPNRAPNSPEWFSLLQEIADRQEIRLAWANTGGEILFDSQQAWKGQTVEELFYPIAATLRRGHWNGEWQESRGRWIVTGLIWPDQQNPQAQLIVAAPAPTFPFLQRFRDTILGPLLQAGALAFAVGILLALLIGRSTARPLQKVAHAAQALAGGNLNARAPIEGPEEVRELAQTFNEMGRQVQLSQQSQRNLVANVAHDLRTPLTSIQGFAQALVDGTATSPENQRQAAQAIYEETQHMRRMTDILLDLARFEAGQITLQQEPIDLASLASRRVAQIRPRAERARITLQIEIQDTMTVLGDTGRLEQVVDNLVENALNHTPSAGKITVSIHSIEPPSRGQSTPPSVLPWAAIVVTDTGRGIPQEDLPRIFERFYRSDKSRGSSGIGLGLAIVREIVHAHGGEVYAESIVDVGSKFTVRLPQHI